MLVLISRVFGEHEAIESVRRGGQDGGARAGTVGDGRVERERSGAGSQTHWAWRDEDEVIV